MKKTPIALQLWSVRDDQKKDFAGTMAAVAKIGYAGVELAGYGNTDVNGTKAAVVAAGLKVAGMHVNLQRLSNELNAVIDEALLLGTKNVTCSWWQPGQLTTPAACQKAGERLAAIGSVLRGYDLRFSFHNHGHELTVVGGRPALEWIFDAASPRDLAAEVDVYWVHVGGQDPASLLRRFGARCPLVHLKDEKEIGLGPVDFDAVFAATDSVGVVEWFIVEQEEYNHAPMESVKQCFEQLRTWGRC